jgi:hypothetical protein
MTLTEADDSQRVSTVSLSLDPIAIRDLCGPGVVLSRALATPLTGLVSGPPDGIARGIACCLIRLYLCGTKRYGMRLDAAYITEGTPHSLHARTSSHAANVKGSCATAVGVRSSCHKAPPQIEHLAHHWLVV